MRFTDYFGKAFAAVSSSQFPWAKLFRESPVSKIIDVSLVLFLMGTFRFLIEEYVCIIVGIGFFFGLKL